ncbi:sugar ABC transporter ATP-binding protein [Skermanella stibiiresistens SB22]|uniref:Sugar ABC transporter ATP-binding protein n=1 Tax=Skermanella stibiiresistens SB22 TaxID=1385369 RepID=W9GY80_9PROT|nr:ABC transporter ATP-binding protein [Skermanella stibiiresistens]EWY36438.1 sugar ABC transporter ATP-binding protein [Skermanella stibiiresistens SB22]
MTTVRFDSVWKRYDGSDLVAVQDLNLACREGEMLALLGPSGCGKSSTLKMAAGLEQVSEGEILFGDRPVSRLSPGERNIAMVFEDYGLYPRLTVRQNISFPLEVRHFTKDEIKKRVDGALELLGLKDMADAGVQGLSGGAQQRVAIGRALVRDPELILFDEPLSHLDGDQKVMLRTEIKHLQKTRGITSILVTHDQTEATAMADRIAVMRHGVLQQVDTPDVLYRRPANVFVANFIGEPPMNLLTAQVAGSTGGIHIDALGETLALGDARKRHLTNLRHGRLIVGARPEHVAIMAPGAVSQANAIVAYREPRGDTDSLVVTPFGSSGIDIRIEMPGPGSFRSGDKVAISLAPENLHLFDTETERNLEIEP